MTCNTSPVLLRRCVPVSRSISDRMRTFPKSKGEWPRISPIVARFGRGGPPVYSGDPGLYISPIRADYPSPRAPGAVTHDMVWRQRRWSPWNFYHPTNSGMSIVSGRPAFSIIRFTLPIGADKLRGDPPESRGAPPKVAGRSVHLQSNTLDRRYGAIYSP